MLVYWLDCLWMNGPKFGLVTIMTIQVGIQVGTIVVGIKHFGLSPPPSLEFVKLLTVDQTQPPARG